VSAYAYRTRHIGRAPKADLRMVGVAPGTFTHKSDSSNVAAATQCPICHPPPPPALTNGCYLPPTENRAARRREARKARRTKG
jgi:hypothetical protein